MCLFSELCDCVCICIMSKTVGQLCLFLMYNRKFFDVQIEDHALYFRERAQSKCGSLDFINHIPRGGDKKVL